MSPKKDIALELEEIWTLLTNGSMAEARKRIEALGPARIPREHVGRLGFLIRRADRPRDAAAYLRRYVYRGGRTLPSATDEEMAEYAMSIGQLGAIPEALSLLEGVSEERYPNATIHRAMLMFSEHRYAESIPILRRLVAREGVARVLHFSARARLAHALAMEEFVKPVDQREFRVIAQALLDDPEVTREHGRVRRYALMILAWEPLFDRDFSRAIERLEALRVECESADDHGGLLEAELWLGVARLNRATEAQAALGAIGEWETIRISEFYLGLLANDLPLLSRLYLGTPHTAFKLRVGAVFQSRGLPLPSGAEWRLGQGTAEPLVIEVANGVRPGSQGYLKEGQVMQRVFAILASDFYRPLRLAEMHSVLYPGAHYESFSGSERVHRVVRRLRGWFREQGLPLTVVEDGG
ncbi:MAG TPA: hypothetical protein VL588_05095, partial [Bdellovibrionota bacterium]|nr:hypothetical protein [Bdellovibrionota bacterium]